MSGYIGSKASVTLVDGYTQAEADAEFVQDPNGAITVSGSNVGIGTASPVEPLDVAGGKVRIGNTKIGHAGAGGDWDMTFETYSGGYYERMRIDSAGRVTMPYQPAFKAHKSTAGDVSYGSNSSISADMNATSINVSNGYNTSNGRFTAPISGYYLFGCNLFNNGTANNRRVVLRINSTGGSVWGQGQASIGDNFELTGIAYINANDYVELKTVYDSTTIFHDVNHSVFYGYLLG